VLYSRVLFYYYDVSKTPQLERKWEKEREGERRREKVSQRFSLLDSLHM
jgi:hypothetical protein